MTTRKWFSLGVALFSAIFVWYLIDHKIIILRQQENNQAVEQANHPESVKSMDEVKQTAAADAAQGNPQIVASDEDANTLKTDKDLQNWIEKESVKLDLKDNNPQDTEKKMHLFAGQLRKNQLDQLLTTSLDAKAAANQKILSTYLLTLNPTDDASENLKKASITPLTIQGDVKPHTVDEVRRAQELSLKYMAIDELAARAKKNVADYNRLVAIANSAPDHEVRSYAERKLKEIGP